MLYDPIDAFFKGITSALFRIPMAIVPLLLALACFALPDAEMGGWGMVAFPFIVLGAVLAWSTQGLGFLVGLVGFVGYVYLAWRFVDTDYPKEVFLGMFAVAFVLLLPMTWFGELPSRIPFVAGGGFVLVYALIGYGLPRWMAWLDGNTNES